MKRLFSSLLGLIAVLSQSLQAGVIGGVNLSSGLPWETPLNKVKNSIAGPVMLSFGTIIIVAIVLMLAVRGELPHIVERIGGTVMVLGAGFGVVSLIAGLFVVTGAVV